MQYFRNMSRRGSDTFPLCREDRPADREGLRSVTPDCGCDRAGAPYGDMSKRRRETDDVGTCGCGTDSRDERETRSGCSPCQDRGVRTRGACTPCTGNEPRERFEREACGASCPLPRSGCECDTSDERARCGVGRLAEEDDDTCTGLAMAFVPDHGFHDLYECDQALCEGSLFKKLRMPFCGQRRKM